MDHLYWNFHWKGSVFFTKPNQENLNWTWLKIQGVDRIFAKITILGFIAFLLTSFFFFLQGGGGEGGPMSYPPCTSPCIIVHLNCIQLLESLLNIFYSHLFLNHYAIYFTVTFSWELRRTRSPFYLLEKWSDTGWKDFEKLSTPIRHQVQSSDCLFWKFLFQFFIKLPRFWSFINKGP